MDRNGGAVVSRPSQNANFCTLLVNTLFGPRVSPNEKNISKIDATLEKLYASQLEKQKKLQELKKNLGLLQDKSNRIDPGGLPRETLIKNTKKRMVAILNHNAQLQKNIDFFTACKYNLENSQMTQEMASHIGSLKKQMIKVGAIDIDKLQEDMDDIAEVNNDLQEVNNAMNDTLVNAWEMDVGEAEELLESYLAESDAESETDVDETRAVVKPIEDPLRRLREEERRKLEETVNNYVDELPSVPTDLEEFKEVALHDF